MKKKLKILVLFLAIGLQTYGQTPKVTGTVTDDTGQSLPGVTVVVTGSKLAVITENNGKYVINAKQGDQLQFSFIGMKDVVQTVGKNLVVNVKMTSDSKALEEVIVVGYSTQKKSTVTGAVTQTTGEKLKRQGNITSVTDALQGAMPGVTVLPTSGIPGGSSQDAGNNSRASDILIRGKNTWNNSAPLILVDGVERNMNDINVNEIATISVLKDASATAVYGMKGGNGVILITTQRGNVGKAKLSVEFNQTYESLSKYPENANTLDGFTARNYAIINEVDVRPTAWDFYLPQSVLQHYRDKDLPFAFPDNNWRDVMVKDYVTSQNANLKVQGGNKFVKYFGSMSFLHQGDIMKTEDIGQGYDPSFSYDRFNFRTNLDFNVTKTTQFSVGLSGVYGKQQRSGAGTTSVFTALSGHAPDAPVIRYEDGVFGNSDAYAIIGGNEYANINLSGTNVDNRTELNSDFTLNQKLDVITKGLYFKGRFAFDTNFSTSGREVNPGGFVSKFIRPDFYLKGGSYNYEKESYQLDGVLLSTADMIAAGYAVYNYPTGATNGFTWVPAPDSFDTEQVTGNASRLTTYYEASLNYNRSFGKHTITGLALFSRQIVNNGSSWPLKREDWVSRAVYDYDNKYFTEINATYNGSEKFGPGNKFDIFPSISVGWNVFKEKFIKDHAKVISNLKLKYSFGIVGNDRIEGEQWGYITTWNQGAQFNQANNNNAFGIANIGSFLKYNEGTPGNPDLRWEKAEKQNYGVEFGFFENALTGSFDYFKEYRYDMLISGGQRTIPNIYGQKAPAANLGIVNSNGFEIEASFSKSFKSGFNFTVGGNFTRAENVIGYKEDAELKPFYQQQAGYPIGQNRINQQIGFIQSYDDLYNGANSINNNNDVLPGDLRMLDYNANGVLDPDDASPYGHPAYPLNTFGVNFNIGYKGWSLSANFYGTQNTTREISYATFFSNSSLIQPYLFEDTWTPEYGNANPTYPQLAFQKASGTGTYNYFDGALVRLRSAELSYTLPKKWSKTFASSQTKLYVSGNNLFLWTDMPADGEGSNLESRTYPLKKTVTIGASIQF